MGRGFLKVETFVADHALPVSYVKITVKSEKGDVIYDLTTDEAGVTKKVELNAPDINGANIDTIYDSPFTPYNVEVELSSRFKKVYVTGVQIFDSITTILPVQLHPYVSDSPDDNIEQIIIPKEHGVQFTREIPPYNNIERGQDQAIMPPEDFLVSLQLVTGNEVAIPEYITVHLGSPSATAQDVRVPFVDYIKNVASSEIFPFWDEAALYANIYAQISFALNRVYT